MTVLADRIPTRCDSDANAQAWLAWALAQPDIQAAAEAMHPHLFDAEDVDLGPIAGWVPGVFELTAAVRAHLPQGLAAGDFDGVNVQRALTP